MSEEEVSRRLENLKSTEWFDYRGKVDHATAIALTAQADVISLPSRYPSECQPLALIQGMCAGKAIVVSDTPALRATLGAYPAVFVPINSVQAIVVTLRQLLHQKRSDSLAFNSRPNTAAAAALARFDVGRFDYEMQAILLLNGDQKSSTSVNRDGPR
jgi:glycosyltransferase involved in cell wall biosynthesis